MQQSKDYFEREEIEKLTMLLKNLIEKVTGLSHAPTQTDIDDINKTLEREFDISISQICEMNSEDLIQRFTKLDQAPADQLTKLLYQLAIKTNKSEYFDKKILANKTCILIDTLNQSSGTFSMERMQMIDRLKQLN